MKKLALLVLIGCSLSLSAQDINYAEYFWDSDPGVGNGVGSPLSPGTDINTGISVDPSGLRAGLHRLGIRTRNTDGEWSVPVIQRVVIRDIVSIEYFWDVDPGVGNGTSANYATTDETYSEDVTFSSEGVSPGNHRLGIRVQGAGEVWSPVNWHRVNVERDYQAGEYFWDTDPGVGNGTAFSLNTEIPDSLDANVEVSTTGLSRGWHDLYIRVRGQHENPGFAKKKRVYVTRQIVGGEYFWDTDPGVGNGTPLGTLTIGTSAQVCDDVTTTGLSEGLHYLYIRTVGDDGVWSVPRRVEMTVTPSTVVVGCPGDFDRNGTVGTSDLLILVSALGSSGDCAVDLTGDFVVSFADLLNFLAVFGETCE